MTDRPHRDRDGAAPEPGDTQILDGKTRPMPAFTVFAQGEILAGRYRIVRFLAEGGMGSVYEAEDLELGERVALKTVRPEIAASEEGMERFKREIHLARKVTHPNVCRIFDLFRHVQGERELLFLTMEMLEGQTLSQRLSDEGPMSRQEALPLIEQMGEALSAAHRAGITHRDFKAANVMLVPAEEGPRAVVTDFGLAAEPIRADGRGGDALTSAGQVVGTPEYMAPEQVRGDEVGPPADIFAFGIVIFEMTTGQRPFDGDTPLSTAVKRLTEAPPSLRELGSDVDPRWEKALLRCLKTLPKDRFRDVRDVARALAGDSKARGRTRRWMVLGSAAILAVALGVIGGRVLRSPPAPAGIEERVEGAEIRTAVAVFDLQNLNRRSEVDWLGSAVAEMLTTELGAGEQLRTVSRDQIVRLWGERGSEGQTPDLQRARQLLGADLVVQGSFIALGPEGELELRIDVRVYDAVKGQTDFSVAAEGSESELLALVARLGEDLRGQLGIAPLSEPDTQTVRASLPASPRAARLYSEGLERLRRFDASAARDLLDQAVAADPDFPLAYVALAEAKVLLGFDLEAEQDAQRAVELGGELSREHRLSVEGRLHAISRRWPEAVQSYERLWGYFLDNLEYGLYLAEAQVRAGDGSAALTTVAALRELPAPAGSDPRIELAEAGAAASLSDYATQAAAAERARVLGEGMQAPLLVARAQLSLGDAQRRQGHAEEARASFTAAREAFQKAGDGRGEASSLNMIGILDWRSGELDGALELWQEALGVFREVGDRRSQSQALNNVAMVRDVQGDFDAAYEDYEEALRLADEIGARQNQAAILNNMAIVRRRQGDLDAATELYRRSLAIKEQIGYREGVASTLNNISQILLDRAELAEARQTLERSVQLWSEIDQPDGLAAAHQRMGRLLIELGEIERAREELETAEGICREAQCPEHLMGALIGLSALAFEQADFGTAIRHQEEILELMAESPDAQRVSRLALVQILLVEGRLEEAESGLEEAIGSESELPVGQEASLSALRAELALQRGELRTARSQLDRVLDIADASGNRRLALELLPLQARILSGSGKRTEAEQRLREGLETLRERGMVRLELEVAIELARLRSDEVEGAALRERARELGYLRLAGD